MVILLVFWVTVTAYTVHPVLPANPIQLPAEEKSPFLHLLPQGWAFFTRDPRLADISPFVKTSDGLWHPARSTSRLWPHPPNFSRRWKLPGVEVGIILGDLIDPPWHACQGPPNSCLENAPSGGTADNSFSHATLCGDVGLVRQALIPWAWREAAQETVMPSDVLRLQISCHE